MEAHRAHIPEVAGSNPAPAILAVSHRLSAISKESISLAAAVLRVDLRGVALYWGVTDSWIYCI